MPTQEIRDTDWQKFCQRFFEAHRDALISLETVSHDGTTAVLAESEPLRVFQFQKTDGCSDTIQLEVGKTQHEIVEPLHVRLRDSEGSQKILEIDAESGSVEMRFTSGRIGAILNEMNLVSADQTGREGARNVGR
jgi:hypothetical protein